VSQPTEPQALHDGLATAVRRHLGAPGEVRALVRLTGSATKATWSFDAAAPLVPSESSNPPWVRRVRGPDVGSHDRRVRKPLRVVSSTTVRDSRPFACRSLPRLISAQSIS
jgi:hypothetical protein